MGDLLVALAEEPAAAGNPADLAAIRAELAALRRDLAAAAQPAAAGNPADLAAIRSEIAALRRDLMVVSSTAPAGPPGAELAELRQEIAGMRKELARFMRQNTLGVVAPPDRAGYRHAPRHLPGESAPMRPVEELLDDVPQIEAEVAPEQLKAYIQRPRVRPEDIQLSQEDIQRQGRNSRLRASDEMRAKLGRPMKSPAENILGALMLIGMIAAIILLCAAMLSL